jgi:transposase
MARKSYSEEFRRQAVDLYGATPGATVRGIADDLGIVRGTLRHWLVETTKLTTEREILQRAAKYFAGETRW